MTLALRIATISIFCMPALAFASEGKPDGDRIAECYATYDALVGLGEAGKLSEPEKLTYQAQKTKAESKALALYKEEGLDEEYAREQLDGRALFMRSELRDIRESVGIYSADEMKALAVACDPLIAN